MRISFILSSLWLSGGVNAVIEYANRLNSRGHNVSIVIPADTIDPAVQTHITPDIKLIESDFPLPPSRNVFHLFRLVLSMVKVIPKGDVVIATHTPTIVPTLLATRLGRKGRFLWLYMDYEEMFERRPLEKFLLKHAPRWVDKTVVLSKTSRQDIWNNTRTSATIVGLGLNQSELFFNQSCQLDLHFKRVLYVGDVRPRKGLKDFLEAAEIVCRLIPHLKLSIVSKKWCDIQTEVPFDFYHYPTREKLAELYRSSHLYVSTSWAEGFGYPPLEAMACGAPVVLTDSRGVREYAQHEENCLMVPPQDPIALAEAMYRVLTDADLTNRLRASGPKTAKRFDWDSAVDRFETALLSVMD